MRFPTREDQERIEYYDREKLKVIKKYARQELDEINKRKFLSPHNETRIKFLKSVLESERFAGLPIQSFPDEAIEEIKNLPFMEDRFIPSTEDYEERLKSCAFQEGKEAGEEIEKQLAKKRDKNRIAKTTDTKKSQRAVKEKYVIEAWTRMVNDKVEKEILKNLSETKMAKRVKERVEEDLKKAETFGRRSVLKSIVDRKGNVIVKGLSPRTIIRILRNRDREKLPFYPWEK